MATVTGARCWERAETSPVNERELSLAAAAPGRLGPTLVQSLGRRGALRPSRRRPDVSAQRRQHVPEQRALRRALRCPRRVRRRTGERDGRRRQRRERERDLRRRRLDVARRAGPGAERGRARNRLARAACAERQRRRGARQHRELRRAERGPTQLRRFFQGCPASTGIWRATATLASIGWTTDSCSSWSSDRLRTIRAASCCRCSFSKTRDPSAPDQSEPSQVALQAWPHDGRLEVRRPANAAGETCFAAVVQDLVGNVSGGGERELCKKTKLPPFFEGCAVAQAGARARSCGYAVWLALLPLALLLLRRRDELCMRLCLAPFELLLLVTASLGCQRPQKSDQPRGASSASSASSRASTPLPRPASLFLAQNGRLRQEHPRLPDTGEWRCAERGGVVWCAGGGAAAGVVSGPPDSGYRCGPRWGRPGKDNAERVCIDQHPDYPGEGYACAFEQEQAWRGVCRWAEASSGPPLTARAKPACWLDRDCPAGRCDRGACGCGAQSDCREGRCENGVCVE